MPDPVAKDSKRSEEQIISMAPIVARLGADDYNIKPLRILAQQKWRQDLIDNVTDIMGELSATASTDAVFLSGLGYAMLKFPEKMLKLVFLYAPDLPQEKIVEEATEEQVARVFGQIVQVAFPFTAELQMISTVLGKSPVNSRR